MYVFLTNTHRHNIEIQSALVPNEGRYWAEKLQTNIILVPLMPDVDAIFGVSSFGF